MNRELPKTLLLEQGVFSITNDETFNSIALEVYHFQFANNPVYQQFCLAINRPPHLVTELADIPFLPISFFKTHKVICGDRKPEVIFESSGTTMATTSRHYVASVSLYQKSFKACFQQFYGNIKNHCVLGLLPSYLERSGSSLVYMVQSLINSSGHPQSGFYLDDFSALQQTIKKLETAGQKTILIGVSYALLDFVETYPMQLKHTTIMDTGGMKGRKEELTRMELNIALQNGFGVKEIHSEYGMTELLSQAYAVNGNFSPPAWMKMILRDESDALTLLPPKANSSGAINVIDLANLYSCSFIATADAGRYCSDGKFEVLGRLDNADVRGCSLLFV